MPDTRLPLVSIGLPVYNGAEYLELALNSLLKQTYANFELIISDNASIDSTAFICKKYCEIDSRIRYIRQSHNTGCHANTQAVLDLANGEYFMWASHDDIWDRKWIEKLLPVASKYQCLATGVYVTIDVDGKQIANPASGRKLQFSGGRFIRRLRFYLEPGGLGKGCPFFGIMPTKLIKEIGAAWLEMEPVGGDTVYLYVILGRMEIRCDFNTVMYKRYHLKSLGEVIRQNIASSGKLEKLLFLIGTIISQPIPNQYSKKSSNLEKICIWLLYPVACIWGLMLEVSWKIPFLRAVFYKERCRLFSAPMI